MEDFEYAPFYEKGGAVRFYYFMVNCIRNNYLFKEFF
jgi:hypothetical protein